MKDCMGRDIKAGDIVAYASSCSSAYLSVGKVLGPAKKDPEKIRVRVFQSTRYSFVYGRKDWKTGQYRREPKQPFDVTLSMGERVVLVNHPVPVES